MDTPRGSIDDPDVVNWHRLATKRGGIVSAADIQSVADYVHGLKISGRWAVYKTCWPDWLDNEIAAHTPIKDG